jgi:hypothetical protein
VHIYTYLHSGIRRYYPCNESGANAFSSNKDPNSTTYYKLGFPSPQGPHYCSDAFIEANQWADFCPYAFKGENAGKYQHPHISLTAVEQYLTNMVMPDKCGEEWEPIKGVYPESSFRDTSIVFPVMESDGPWVQSMVPYTWPSTPDRKGRHRWKPFLSTWSCKKMQTQMKPPVPVLAKMPVTALSLLAWLCCWLRRIGYVRSL